MELRVFLRLVSVGNSLFVHWVLVAFEAVLGFCDISKILRTMLKRWEDVERFSKNESAGHFLIYT